MTTEQAARVLAALDRLATDPGAELAERALAAEKATAIRAKCGKRLEGVEQHVRSFDEASEDFATAFWRAGARRGLHVRIKWRKRLAD